MVGYGEGATSLLSKESFKFIVDEPPKLGGKGMGEAKAWVRLLRRVGDSSTGVNDRSPPLPGWVPGPNPLTYFLGSLVGCTQYTMTMVGKEMKVPELSRVTWSASGEYVGWNAGELGAALPCQPANALPLRRYDLRGVRGEAGTDARFQKVALTGTVDTEASQEDLDRIQGEVERRCIIAATCAASGACVCIGKGAVLAS